MSTRQILAAITIVPLLTGLGTAEAAKKKPPARKPVCNIMRDVKDDATETGTPQKAPNDPNLDILSADVAADAGRLTIVIRLASMSDTTNTNWQFGRGFDVTFTARGTAVPVRAILSAAGNTFYDGKGTGIVDTAKKEVRVTVPMASLKVPLKLNEKITDISAKSWRYVGNTQVTAGWADRADAVAPGYYIVGWPSCVKVGA